MKMKSTEIELELLQDEIAEINRSIDMGQTTYNWISPGT